MSLNFAKYKACILFIICGKCFHFCNFCHLSRCTTTLVSGTSCLYSGHWEQQSAQVQATLRWRSWWGSCETWTCRSLLMKTSHCFFRWLMISFLAFNWRKQDIRRWKPPSNTRSDMLGTDIVFHGLHEQWFASFQREAKLYTQLLNAHRPLRQDMEVHGSFNNKWIFALQEAKYLYLWTTFVIWKILF